MRRSVLGGSRKIGYSSGGGFGKLPVGTVLFRDDFSDGVSQTLDTGGRTFTTNPFKVTWTVFNNAWTTDGLGNAVKNTSNTGHSFVNLPTPDIDVTLSHVQPDINTNACNSGLVFNYKDANNFHMLKLIEDSSGGLPTTNNLVQMYGKSAGSYTLFGSYTPTEPAGTYAMRVVTNGPVVKWFYNGVQLQTYNNANRPNANATGVGLFCEANSASVAANVMNQADFIEVKKA